MSFSEHKIGNILFATDLSENADRAFNYAAGMAAAYGARITVLHAVEKLPPNAEMLLAAHLGSGSLEELREKTETERIVLIKAHIENFCSEASGRMPECPFILHEVIVEPGKAPKRILHHAGTGAYDVVVMGSRGIGLVEEALLGGTSRKVIQNCPIPVFIIPMKP